MPKIIMLLSLISKLLKTHYKTIAESNFCSTIKATPPRTDYVYGIMGGAQHVIIWNYGGSRLENMNFPECMACDDGTLVPLSDFGGQGAAVHYKAWVCIAPECDYNIKIRNGEVHEYEPILQGNNRRPR
ncbi:MAG: hypothetical protein QF908_03960 [Dehalococcoidia bacterium]|jgi:hypothetical protein|nr:hypothetical protein [Dehalococcoidia bacterium]